MSDAADPSRAVGRAPVPGVLGRVASAVYRRVIAARNKRFDAGRGVVELDRPVVSVGNLSTGGTGKTPLVRAVVRWLLEDGKHPAIAMRGYGTAPYTGLQSDEAREYAMSFGAAVPIVAQPDRVEGLIELFGGEVGGAGAAVDCVVMDDGFQHRRLARACDIVVVDCTRSPFDDALLPAGHLREGPMSLRRAHAVVLTHTKSVTDAQADSLEQRCLGVNAGLVVARADHAWSGFTVRAGGGSADGDAGAENIRDWVYLACAIGNPQRFVKQAEGEALSIAGTMVLRDHDPFEPKTLRKLLDELERTKARALWVTPKDWPKLAVVKPEAWPCPVLTPNVEARFSAGEAELRALVLGKVRAFAEPGTDRGDSVD